MNEWQELRRAIWDAVEPALARISEAIVRVLEWINGRTR